MKEIAKDKGNLFTVAKTTHSEEKHQQDTTSSQFLLAQVNRKMTELLAPTPLPSGLYLIATPIGNLADISLRALATLFKVDAIYCEDTRHSKKLLSHFGIRKNLHPYHEHNAKTEGSKILARIQSGEAIALISDAGTPLISDPGFTLVKDAHLYDLMVTSIPGPSAVITAISLAGLPTDTFTFVGFLPPKKGARQSKLLSLKKTPSTLIFYESPKRIHKTLLDLKVTFQERFCVIARELTKLHESLYRGSASDLADNLEAIPAKGEFVILVAPYRESDALLTDAFILEQLQAELKTATMRDAVQTITKQLGLPKKKVYALGLSLKKE